MPAFTVEIKNLDAILAALKGLPDAVGRAAVSKVVRAASKIVLEQAKANCPVETGALRKSLTVRVTKKKKRNIISFSVLSSKGTFKAGHYYGGYVEFGTKHRPANGFVRRAYESEKEQAKEYIEANLEKEVEAAVAREKVG